MKKLALIFDFDNTLAPDNMHEHSFLNKILKISKEDFYKELAIIEQKYNADYVLNMMRGLIEIPLKHNIKVTRQLFNDVGKELPLFSGVESFFSRIREFGKEYNVEVEFYIISSGYKEILEGTAIHKEFNAIYASEFCYDNDGFPIWPKMCINYSNKVQFISRIRKGITDRFEHIKINQKVPAIIPYSHMIYFGDGETDVPSFKFLKMYGGKSVCVYTPESEASAKRLLKDERITTILPANYENNFPLDLFVKKVIKKLK